MLSWGGGGHFDPRLDNPFDYVLVLLCCQQYAAAISHLCKAQQIIPATHLACVCLYLGLVSPADALLDEVQGAGVFIYIYTVFSLPPPLSHTRTQAHTNTHLY